MPPKPSLKSLLCSDAYKGHKLYPEACQNCESPCVPGKDWLRSLGLPLPVETRDSIYPNAMPDLKTTFHSIGYRRYKSYMSQRK